MNATNGEINRRENTARARGRCFPRPAALHSIGVDSAAALFGEHPYRAHVCRVMGELELFDSRMATFDVFDAMKELRIFAERSRDGAQSTYVLGVSPTRVVTPAITV